MFGISQVRFPFRIVTLAYPITLHCVAIHPMHLVCMADLACQYVPIPLHPATLHYRCITGTVQCAPHVHYTYSPCSLPAHYMYITGTVHVDYMHLPGALHVQYMCITCTLHVQSMCIACAAHAIAMCRPGVALHIPCSAHAHTCTTQVQPMHSPRTRHVHNTRSACTLHVGCC